MPITTQFGIGAESTYGTPVTVNRFFPFASESVQRETAADQTRVGAPVPTGRPSRRPHPYTIGAAGSVEMPLYGRGRGSGSSISSGRSGDHRARRHRTTHGDGRSDVVELHRTGEPPSLRCGGCDEPAFTWSGGKVAVGSCEAEGARP